MHIKHSLNILMSRYGIIFKVIVYCAIALLFMLTIAYSIAAPILEDTVQAIHDTGWNDTIEAFVRAFLNGEQNVSDTFSNIGLSIGQIYSILVNNHVAVVDSIVVFVVFAVVAIYILNLAHLSYSDVINHFMNSHFRFGFISNFIYNLKKSALYSLLYLVTKVPLALVVCTIVFFMGYGLVKSGLLLLALPLCYMVGILLFSLVNVLFMGWVPAIVVDGVPVHKAINAGVDVIGKHFTYSYMNSFMANFLSGLFVVLCAICTFGAGLLIAVPTAIMFRKILELVLYYSAKGYKYYSSDTTVVEGKLNA